MSLYLQQKVWHLESVKSRTRVWQVSAEARLPAFFLFQFFAKDGGSFPASLFHNRLFCVSCSYKMTVWNICKHIFCSRCQKISFFFYKQLKQVCCCVRLSFSVMYPPLIVLFFWAQFSSYSLLCPPMPPVVVETTAVRNLSGVGYYLWPCLVSQLWNAW